jgi:hypothetical protein
MLDIDPKLITFRDVRLNTSYSSTFTIANPLTVSVEFSLKTSSSRYTVNPSSILLQPNQSMVITVRLFLSNYSNISRGIRGQEDQITIKSSYFEQKVDLMFYLREYNTTSSSSPSPLRGGSRSGTPVRASSASALTSAAPDRAGGSRSKMSHADEIKLKNDMIQRLEEENQLLQSKYPNMQDVIRSRIEQERIQFEEKSEKILLLLKRKDETISNLQSDLEKATAKNHALMTTRGGGGRESDDIGAESKAASRNSRNGRFSASSWNHSDAKEDADVGAGRSSIHVHDQSSLELEIEKLRIDLQNELLAHNATSEKLSHFQNENLNFRMKVQGYEQKLSELASPRLDEKISLNKYQQEIRALTEKNTDQSEQIHILVSEISKLRSNAQTWQARERELQSANDQNAALRKDLLGQQQRYSDLKKSMEAMEKKTSEQREVDAKMITQLQKYTKDLESMMNFQRGNSANNDNINANRELFQEIGQSLRGSQTPLRNGQDPRLVDDRYIYLN